MGHGAWGKGLKIQGLTIAEFGDSSIEELRESNSEAGTILPGADLQIAATAIYQDLELVSANLRHF